MELIGTKEKRNAPVAAAIGEESRDDKKTANLKHKKPQKKNKKNKKNKTLYVNILTF